MGLITHNINYSYVGGDNNLTGRTIAITGDSEQNVDIVCPLSTVTTVTMAIDASKIGGFFVSVDGTTGDTIEFATNEADPYGANQWILTVGGSPILYAGSPGSTCPITTNVTEFFITVGAITSAPIVHIRCVLSA